MKTSSAAAIDAQRDWVAPRSMVCIDLDLSSAKKRSIGICPTGREPKKQPRGTSTSRPLSRSNTSDDPAICEVRQGSLSVLKPLPYPSMYGGPRTDQQTAAAIR